MGSMEDKNKTREELEKEVLELRTQCAEKHLYETLNKWALGQIRIERSQLETILNSLPSGVNIVSSDYRIEYQNQWSKQRFGNKINKICYEACMKKSEPCKNCPVAKAIRQNKIIQGEIVAGDMRSYEIIASPIGEFEGKKSGVEIILDVTEQKQMEEAFLQSQKKYADLINSLNVGVYQTAPGREGRFMEVNPYLVSMLEANSKEELLRCDVSRLYHDPRKREAVINKALKFGSIKDEEVELVTLQGKRFWASLALAKVEDSEGNIYFNGIMEDITKRKKIDEG